MMKMMVMIGRGRIGAYGVWENEILGMWEVAMNEEEEKSRSGMIHA